VALPTRPGNVLAADHDEAAVIAVGGVIGLVATEKLVGPLEIGDALDPGAEAEVNVDRRQVKGADAHRSHVSSTWPAPGR
jgi:hypothetical protein